MAAATGTDRRAAEMVAVFRDVGGHCCNISVAADFDIAAICVNVVLIAFTGASAGADRRAAGAADRYDLTAVDLDQVYRRIG